MNNENFIVKLEFLGRLIDEIRSDAIDLRVKLNTGKRLYSAIKREFNIDPLQSCERATFEEAINKC